ncbi:DUF4998 domain-containing protein [Filimonas effusa]|nr:DUF4998 domain-containing protein [Filimonas effusa]
MNYNKPFSVKLFWVAVVALLGGACSKIDEYKEKYTPNGETTYTGKVDSIRIYSGHNRIKFSALLSPDPRVTSYRVYWGGRADSATFTVSHNEPGGRIEQIVTKLPESEQSFEFVTFDASGNKSISSYKNGTVYGSRYQESLLNRTLFGSTLDTSLQTRLQLAVMDAATGVFDTEIRYQKSSGDSAVIHIPLAVTDTLLKDHKYGSEVIFRTWYHPDSTCIDTFSTAFAKFQPVSGPTWIDRTSRYVKNYGNQFQRSSWDGSRWGILADWTTSADVKNSSAGYGGYELRSSVGVLSMEGGWGLPAVNNGKIYQVINLPSAGKWKFTVPVDDQGTVGTKYIAVNYGNSLPDFANITTASYYVNFSNMGAKAQPSIEFTTTGPQTVCIGFVASLPNTGSYFKVKRVTLSWLLE